MTTNPLVNSFVHASGSNIRYQVLKINGASADLKDPLTGKLETVPVANLTQVN
jgi:hypothetical protein